MKVRIEDKEDFLAYLQAHELELFSGSSTPYLGELPAEWQVNRLDVSMDWEAIQKGVQMEQRLGDAVYSITYTHPLCGKNQHYILRMTSFGRLRCTAAAEFKRERGMVSFSEKET